MNYEMNAQPNREEHGPKQLRARCSVLARSRFASVSGGYSSPFLAAGCVESGRSRSSLAEKAKRSVRSSRGFTK